MPSAITEMHRPSHVVRSELLVGDFALLKQALIIRPKAVAESIESEVGSGTVISSMVRENGASGIVKPGPEGEPE